MSIRTEARPVQGASLAMSLTEDLRRPGALPGQGSRAGLVETHISWVFLADRDVYKVKKPVDFGFLDFRSLEQRRLACEAEVRLNARLAPDVYLEVVPVRRAPDGTHRIDGADAGGVVVDWAVHMVRLDDDRRGDQLLTRGALDGPSIDALAEHLERFHAGARSDAETSRFGAVDAVEKSVRENFAQAGAAAAGYLRPAEADEIEEVQTRFLREHAGLFEQRAAAGRVRDGHGDLRLEHVYLDGGRITVIDCIEFNDRFRFADVCADIAFLSMDLAWHGRVDLAERFLARYARQADDYDLYSLADFYEGYRAYVRAKVSMLTAAEPNAALELRRRAEIEARRYLLLALSSGRRSVLTPSLVCVGGVVATGKSTVAEQIGQELGAPVLEADRTRKHLLGVAPTFHIEDRPWQGAYDPQVTERVYAEVLRRADVVLSSGRPVVVDASFRSRAMRRRARDLAAEQGVPFRFVECRAAPEVCRRRLERRERESGVSDARSAMLDEFRTSFEPTGDLAPDEHVVVDTAQPLDASLATVRPHLATWPRGPRGPMS